MNSRTILLAIVIVLVALFFIGGSVDIQEVSGGERDYETRYVINNCGGTGTVTREIEMGGSVGLGDGNNIEVGYDLLKAGLSRHYDISQTRRQAISIEVKPGSKMDVRLHWRLTQHLGQISVLPHFGLLESEYRVYLPTDVEIDNQEDLGCGGETPPSCDDFTAHARGVDDNGNQISQINSGDCLWLKLDWCGFSSVTIESVALADQSGIPDGSSATQELQVRICPTFTTIYAVVFRTDSGSETIEKVRIEVPEHPNVTPPPSTPYPSTEVPMPTDTTFPTSPPMETSPPPATPTAASPTFTPTATDIPYPPPTQERVDDTPAPPPPGQSVDITIDRGDDSVYQAGERLVWCYSFSDPEKGARRVRVLDCQTGIECRIMYDVLDDGTGACYKWLVVPPYGTETLRIESYLDGEVLASDTTSFTVTK